MTAIKHGNRVVRRHEQRLGVPLADRRTIQNSPACRITGSKCLTKNFAGLFGILERAAHPFFIGAPGVGRREAGLPEGDHEFL
jgi:hypothetical protein